MTRGNQRELARAKNQKKQADANKGKRSESNTSIAARKEADAEALRAKQAAKAAKAAEAAAGGK
ncbi:SERF-like protein [Pseudozyma hubeiensis]|nr:SERF-like protein [Pseudozyma hubeiensis]